MLNISSKITNYIEKLENRGWTRDNAVYTVFLSFIFLMIPFAGIVASVFMFLVGQPVTISFMVVMTLWLGFPFYGGVIISVISTYRKLGRL